MRFSVFGTGGTIAERAGKLEGWMSTDEVLERVEVAVPSGVRLQPTTVTGVHSCDFTALDATRLARLIRDSAQNEKTDGVLVLHGTDTLGELAFLLTIWHDGKLPVVLTGARTPCSQVDSDAPRQVRDSLTALTSLVGHTRGGAIVVFDGEVLDPMWVRKTGYSNQFSFATPPQHPPVRVDTTVGQPSNGPPARALRTIRELLVETVPADFPFVPVFDTYAVSADGFRQVLERFGGPIVVRGTGAGHVSRDAAAALKDWVVDGRVAIAVAADGHGMGPVERRALETQAEGVLASPLDSQRTRLLAASLVAAGRGRQEIFAALKELWLLTSDPPAAPSKKIDETIGRWR